MGLDPKSQRPLGEFGTILREEGRSIRSEGPEALRQLIDKADEEGRDAFRNAAWRALLTVVVGEQRDRTLRPFIDEALTPDKLDDTILNKIIDRAEQLFADSFEKTSNPQFDRLHDHWDIARELIRQADSVPDFPEPKRIKTTTPNGNIMTERANSRLRYCLAYDHVRFVQRWCEQVDDDIPLNFYGTALYGRNNAVNLETMKYLIQNNASGKGRADVLSELLQHFFRNPELQSGSDAKALGTLVDMLFEKGLDPNDIDRNDRPVLAMILAADTTGKSDHELFEKITERLLEQPIKNKTVDSVYGALADPSDGLVGPISTRIVRELLSRGHLPTPSRMNEFLQKDSDEFVSMLEDKTTDRQRTFSDVASD